MAVAALGVVLLAAPAPAQMSVDDAMDEFLFLEALFALTDEAASLNAEVIRWFQSGGKEGLYPADYLEPSRRVRAEIERLAVPKRGESVQRYLLETLHLQHAFVAEWYDALERGRPFSSQLSDEYAYHEGLHRSHRLLLKSYAELRALFPTAGAETHRTFRDHLRAMDLKR